MPNNYKSRAFFTSIRALELFVHRINIGGKTPYGKNFIKTISLFCTHMILYHSEFTLWIHCINNKLLSDLWAYSSLLFHMQKKGYTFTL